MHFKLEFIPITHFLFKKKNILRDTARILRSFVEIIQLLNVSILNSIYYVTVLLCTVYRKINGLNRIILIEHKLFNITCYDI